MCYYAGGLTPLCLRTHSRRTPPQGGKLEKCIGLKKQYM